MTDFLLSLDQSALLVFNGYHTPWLDTTMKAISGKWIWVPLYAVLVMLLFKRCGWRRALLYLVTIALIITCADRLCAGFIRPLVERLRPADPLNPFHVMVQTIGGYCPRSYSFPSCHAANTFALAAFLAPALRNRGLTWFLFAWATVVSISRLYLGVHHPGDVLAGAVIGSAIALAFWWLVSKINFGKKALFALALLLLPSLCNAQRFEWGGEFATIFDNREGNAVHTPAQTYFLTRLAPEIGVSFGHRRHRVMGGVVWTQPIGCEWDGHRISPTLFYRYDGGRLKASLGMFPRTHLTQPLPEYLVSDSTRYFQHNLRGALLQYVSCRGYFEALVDWRGMQTAKRREAFAIIARGEWQPPRKVVRIGATAMLNHLAKVKNAPADQFVVDNLMVNPQAGVDFSHLMPRSWHELSLRAGLLASLTRHRADNRWRSAAGVRAELNARWWRVALRNVTWAGNRPLFPLYSSFGPQLNEGEPYLASRFYNRTELSGLLLAYKHKMTLRAELDFHVADHSDFMFYQRLILNVTI